jgi:hypothetical protein
MFFSVPISWCIFFDWEMVNRRLKTGCTGYRARQQQLMSCNPIPLMSFGKGLPCKIRSWSAAIWMWIWPRPMGLAMAKLHGIHMNSWAMVIPPSWEIPKV